jgi:2-C-methyl-D-erythritol 4-phosphate cytidylyltransferase
VHVWSVVLAAGSSSRFGGGRPKQYEPLGDRRVLDWSLAHAATVAEGVVLVVGPDRVDHPEPGADVVVAGGARRADSVRAALAVIPAEADVIVVHDAARPLAGPVLFAAVVEAVGGGADAAVPGLPVADTIKRVVDHRVVGTLDRAELVAVQTPQAFRADVLRRAHADGADATDDAALVEAAGGEVVVVPGDPAALKITRLDDLRVAALHLPAPGDGG